MKTRQGNRLAEDSPRNTYETRDGRWIGISASSQRTFERLVETMGRPELAKDPRYADNVTRCAHADELDALIADWFNERDLSDVMYLLDRANVVAGPVYDIRDIMADGHYQARENIVAVPDGDFGFVRMQNVTSRFSRTPGRVRHAGGDIGADNAEVFAGIGIGSDEQRRLAAAGVI